MNLSKRDAHSRFFLIHQHRTKHSFHLQTSPRRPHSGLLAFSVTTSFVDAVEIDRPTPGLIGDSLRTHAAACNLSVSHSYLDDCWSGFGLSHYLYHR